VRGGENWSKQKQGAEDEEGLGVGARAAWSR
jgi:hypothetical protein